MFPQPDGGRRRIIQELVAKFREKGATSAEKAMTAQELDLPPRFEQAMARRLGATGIFVAVNGKYYLDETKLRQFQEERRAGSGITAGGGGGGGWGSTRTTMLALRIVRMVVGLAAVLLALSNLLFVQSLSLRFVTVGLVVVWIVLTVIQLFYLSRMRQRWGRRPMQGMGIVATPGLADQSL